MHRVDLEVKNAQCHQLEFTVWTIMKEGRTWQGSAPLQKAISTPGELAACGLDPG